MNRRGFEKLKTRINHCVRISSNLLGAYPHLNDVPVAVAVIPYLNAGALPVPSGGDAILMNLGLSHLNDFFIKHDNLLNQKADHAVIKQELTALAKAIFGSRRHFGAMIAAAPELLAADSEMRLKSSCCMAMATLFILLHEYGHIACGHTKELRKWPRLELQTYEDRIKYCETMRNWEYEADQFAHDAMMGKFVTNGFSAPDASQVRRTIIDVFFTMALSAGDVLSPDHTATHPHPKVRLYRLLGITSDADFQEYLLTAFDEVDKNNTFIEDSLIPLLRDTGFSIRDDNAGDGIDARCRA
jgi:hypothetical protein